MIISMSNSLIVNTE